MPGFSVQPQQKQKPKPQPKGGDKSAIPSLVLGVKEKVSKIQPLSLKDLLDETKAAGWDIALVGESKSGKTDSAITLGYLNLEFKDVLLKAGYDHIVSALEAGVIPEVKKIVVVDSEGALRTQLAYPYEKTLFAPLRDRISVIPVDVKNLMKIADPSGNVVYDEESIKDVISSVRDFMAAIDYVSKLSSDTLIVVDSMSVYKLLLDAYTGFIMNLKSEGVTDPRTLNEIRMQRWQDRNSLWLDTLTKLRNFPGWAVSTYMMKMNSEWVVKSFNAPRLTPVWTETTEYRYDMVVNMEIERNTNVRVASVLSGRYVNTDNPAEDTIEIYGKIEVPEDRVQFLRVIENALRIMKGGAETWDGKLL